MDEIYYKEAGIKILKDSHNLMIENIYHILTEDKISASEK